MSRRPARIPATRARTLRALVLLPDPEQAGLTERERIALRLRNDATLSRLCVCGALATRPRYRRGGVERFSMLHESDCPAASEVCDEIARRLGPELRYRAVVAEVQVA